LECLFPYHVPPTSRPKLLIQPTQTLILTLSVFPPSFVFLTPLYPLIPPFPISLTQHTQKIIFSLPLFFPFSLSSHPSHVSSFSLPPYQHTQLLPQLRQTFILSQSLTNSPSLSLTLFLSHFLHFCLTPSPPLPLLVVRRARNIVTRVITSLLAFFKLICSNQDSSLYKGRKIHVFLPEKEVSSTAQKFDCKKSIQIGKKLHTLWQKTLKDSRKIHVFLPKKEVSSTAQKFDCKKAYKLVKNYILFGKRL
jgi:hypothetical protein